MNNNIKNTNNVKTLPEIMTELNNTAYNMVQTDLPIVSYLNNTTPVILNDVLTKDVNKIIIFDKNVKNTYVGVVDGKSYTIKITYKRLMLKKYFTTPDENVALNHLHHAYNWLKMKMYIHTTFLNEMDKSHLSENQISENEPDFFIVDYEAPCKNLYTLRVYSVLDNEILVYPAGSYLCWNEEIGEYLIMLIMFKSIEDYSNETSYFKYYPEVFSF